MRYAPKLPSQAAIIPKKQTGEQVALTTDGHDMRELRFSEKITIFTGPKCRLAQTP
jgi:hypothetical protein